MRPIPPLLPLLAAFVPSAGASEAVYQDLTELSLEELMNIDVEVTSVSHKRERLEDTAAAVYVITAEDIRRSGVQSIPEALRLAPGLHVARLNAGAYAISARGFANEFANKMLVLIDGRSVYSPLFSGVYWSIQDPAMEDVERIEVIRGPGSTVWGANAVNGVINIITKRADAVDGGTVSLVVGTEYRTIGTLRAGGPLGDYGWLRAYSKTREIANLDPPATGIESGLESAAGGFRADWDFEDDVDVTIQGDLYRADSTASESFALPTAPFFASRENRTRMEGGNLTGHWNWKHGDGDTSAVRAYANHFELRSEDFQVQIDTLDFEYRRRTPVGTDHSLMYGAGARWTHSETEGTERFYLTPDERTFSVVSAFVQDEYQATDDLELTFGTKIEHNDFTGFEIQPSARFSLAQGEDSTIWGAVSRAVRTPSQVDDDMRILVWAFPEFPMPGTTTLLELQGDRDFDSEELIAYELGYRTRPTKNSSLDVAAFLHSYDDLSTFEIGSLTPTGPDTFTLPLLTENRGDGFGYGLETAIQWIVSEAWTIHANYSLLLLDLDTDEGSTDTVLQASEDQAPKHQFHLRSYYDLTETVELDTAFWYVDDVGATVGDSVRADVRLGWNPNEDVRFSVGVQSIFHDDEDEYPLGAFGEYYGVETGAYVSLGVSF